MSAEKLSDCPNEKGRKRLNNNGNDSNLNDSIYTNENPMIQLKYNKLCDSIIDDCKVLSLNVENSNCNINISDNNLESESMRNDHRCRIIRKEMIDNDIDKCETIYHDNMVEAAKLNGNHKLSKNAFLTMDELLTMRLYSIESFESHFNKDIRNNEIEKWHQTDASLGSGIDKLCKYSKQINNKNNEINKENYIFNDNNDNNNMLFCGLHNVTMFEFKEQNNAGARINDVKFPNYLSFSRDFKTARNFAHDRGIIFGINLSNNKNVIGADISWLSTNKGENEYLFSRHNNACQLELFDQTERLQLIVINPNNYISKSDCHDNNDDNNENPFANEEIDGAMARIRERENENDCIIIDTGYGSTVGEPDACDDDTRFTMSTQNDNGIGKEGEIGEIETPNIRRSIISKDNTNNNNNKHGKHNNRIRNVWDSSIDLNLESDSKEDSSEIIGKQKRKLKKKMQKGDKMTQSKMRSDHCDIVEKMQNGSIFDNKKQTRSQPQVSKVKEKQKKRKKKRREKNELYDCGVMQLKLERNLWKYERCRRCIKYSYKCRGLNELNGSILRHISTFMNYCDFNKYIMIERGIYKACLKMCDKMYQHSLATQLWNNFVNESIYYRNNSKRKNNNTNIDMNNCQSIIKQIENIEWQTWIYNKRYYQCIDFINSVCYSNDGNCHKIKRKLGKAIGLINGNNKQCKSICMMQNKIVDLARKGIKYKAETFLSIIDLMRVCSFVSMTNNNICVWARYNDYIYAAYWCIQLSFINNNNEFLERELLGAQQRFERKFSKVKWVTHFDSYNHPMNG